jgi:hypothetical protein
MLLAEFVGRQVLQTRMQPNRIEVTLPLLDHELGLRASAKPFDIEARVAKLSIEALIVAILPGLARSMDAGSIYCSASHFRIA